MQPVQGLHHITAVASDPQRNSNFYHNVLGQRLVKKTVNFDDPGTYHFSFGDEVGTPGTILTFFPWRGMQRGVLGNGETSAVAYTIPTGSVDYWQARLRSHNVTVGELQTRFGQTVLPLHDPDGMVIELIATDEPSTVQVWQNGPVPAEHALRGFHGVTLWQRNSAEAGRLLTESLGYEWVGEEGARTRYQGASADVGLYVDLLERPDGRNGRFGAGSIHHIAFRTVDDTEQQEYLQTLRQAGYGVTDVKDRQYFNSIYFRAPGGVLFEIATDAPGFLYDESIEALGSSLKLPVWLEPQRAEIEQLLPQIDIRQIEQG